MNILRKCYFHDDKAAFEKLKSNLWPDGPARTHFSERQFVGQGQGEYGSRPMHTNTIEGYLSKFKRVMEGISQHRSKKHLLGYSAGVDF